MKNTTKGTHLIVTGFVFPDKVGLLNDSEALGSLLVELVHLVGMKPLTEPQFVAVPLDEGQADSTDDCGGVTGFIILSTSHISVHTWPLHRRVSLDLYSCHTFDPDLVLEFLRLRLGLCGANIVELDRTPPADPESGFQFRVLSFT